MRKWNNKITVILIKGDFDFLHGAIVCSSHGKQIRAALEVAKKKHAESDNEGGEYINYLLGYLPDEMKKYILYMTQEVK